MKGWDSILFAYRRLRPLYKIGILLFFNKPIKVRAVSLTKVLSSERIDIAKFDWGGCEYSLLSVPCHIIRKIPK